jgi:hypothetical protein
MKPICSRLLWPSVLTALLTPPFSAGALGSATPPDFRVGQRWRLSGGVGIQDSSITIVRLSKKVGLAEGRVPGSKGVAVVLGADVSDNSLAVFDYFPAGLKGYKASDQIMRVCLFEYGASPSRLVGVSAYAPLKRVGETDFANLSKAYYRQHRGSTFKQASQSIVSGIGNAGTCTLERLK